MFFCLFLRCPWLNSAHFRYGLKDLFTLHKLADKAISKVFNRKYFGKSIVMVQYCWVIKFPFEWSVLQIHSTDSQVAHFINTCYVFFYILKCNSLTDKWKRKWSALTVVLLFVAISGFQKFHNTCLSTRIWCWLILVKTSKTT